MSSAYDINPFVVGAFYRINADVKRKTFTAARSALDKSASKASPILRRFMSLETTPFAGIRLF